MAKDYTNVRQGRLYVLHRAENREKDNAIQWLCKCDCGKTKILTQQSLNSGTKSCGCLYSVGNSRPNNNTYDLSGEYGIGYTRKNQPFYFDLEDYDKIKKYVWHYSHNYVCAKDIELGKQIFMHRLVLDCINENILVDHINHIEHDNRKSNLRKANSSENGINKKYKKREYPIGVRPVNYGLWEARINKNKKEYTKCFKTMEEASKWRKEMEVKLHGDFVYKEQEDMRGIIA